MKNNFNFILDSDLSKDDILEWDVLNWFPVLKFWASDINFMNLKVLALGERNGGVSLYFASLGANVICSDYKGIPDQVIKKHSKFSFSSKIEYAEIDIFHIPFNDNTFDIVVCKSVIGGLKLNQTRTLPNQLLAMNEIYRVLKKDGYFLGAENMKGSKFLNKLRIHFKKNDDWRYFTIKEIKLLLTNFSKVNLKYFGLVPSVTRIFIFNYLISFANKVANNIFRNNCKYIVFIKCKK